MTDLKILSLGQFQVTLDGLALDDFATNKTRALLAYLVIEKDAPQRRDFLAEMLWPEHSNTAALRNLRLTIFRLQQTFKRNAHAASLPGEASAPITVNRQSLQFTPNPATWIDVYEYEKLLSECDRHLHTSLSECPACIEKLAQAVSYYRGEFLEGFSLEDSYAFEEWLLLSRARLHQKTLEALDQLASHFLHKAEYAASLEERKLALEKTLFYARRALQIEAWHESAHQQVIKALATGGQTQEALAQFQNCRQIILKEFGIEPDPTTVKLYEQVRSRAFDIRAITQLAQSPPNRPLHNLPPQLTPLIGRSAQLSRLEHLLFSYRWVTLVGEGGIGKTRLALTAAEQVLQRFPDGVWYVPLADGSATQKQVMEIRQIPNFLTRAIADALHIPLTERDAIPDQLYEYLKNKKLLLVLDSFERISRGAYFILDLLVNAPNINIMVTTRQFLHFQAGYVMQVDGLPVPEQEDDPDGARYASVQLFAERVERLSGSYILNEKNLPVVIRICRLLDGIPLAIELAAPWAIKLPLEAIASAIQNDLDFLTTTMTGILDRHQSMRAVFESSWGLLTPQEQRVLALCSSLQGEFTYEQAWTASQAGTQDVENLADKFLIIRTNPGQYKIHDTLRQFATEKLDEMKMSH